MRGVWLLCCSDFLEFLGDVYMNSKVYLWARLAVVRFMEQKEMNSAQSE